MFGMFFGWFLVVLKVQPEELLQSSHLGLVPLMPQGQHILAIAGEPDFCRLPVVQQKQPYES